MFQASVGSFDFGKLKEKHGGEEWQKYRIIALSEGKQLQYIEFHVSMPKQKSKEFLFCFNQSGVFWLTILII